MNHTIGKYDAQFFIGLMQYLVYLLPEAAYDDD